MTAMVKDSGTKSVCQRGELGERSHICIWHIIQTRECVCSYLSCPPVQLSVLTEITSNMGGKFKVEAPVWKQSYSFLTEIQFLYHKIHAFKIYYSVGFSISTRLYNTTNSTKKCSFDLCDKNLLLVIWFIKYSLVVYEDSSSFKNNKAKMRKTNQKTIPKSPFKKLLPLRYLLEVLSTH